MKSTATLVMQSWTCYAIAVSFVLSRIIFRRIALTSIKRLQADDWLMIGVLVPFTASIVLANRVSDLQTAREREFRYILEEMQTITMWMVKACLLTLYWRIFTVEIFPWKRRMLIAVSVFCGLCFLLVQFTLFACRPTTAHWSLQSPNAQCVNYRLHTIIGLAFGIPDTFFITILPISFIPTPRRLLLAVLLILSMLAFTAGIRSRVLVLQHPTLTKYVKWYTLETSLSIIFANLPFLTSLVVTTAPSRIRHLSSSLLHSNGTGPLSPWPRSRLGSLHGGSDCRSCAGDKEAKSRCDIYEVQSSGRTSSELHTPVDLEQGLQWKTSDFVMTPSPTLSNHHTDKPGHDGDRDCDLDRDLDPNCLASHDGHSDSRNTLTTLPAPNPAFIAARKPSLPKMRLSGGLAEMGEDLSMVWMAEEQRESPLS